MKNRWHLPRAIRCPRRTILIGSILPMRYCVCTLLFASALLAEEEYEGHRGSQAIDVIGGIQHSGAGTNPVAGIRIRGGLSRMISGYGEFAYSRTQNSVFLQGGNNGELRASLI